MSYFDRGDIRLYYEERGEGFPVLLFAPGGMRSAVSFWEQSPYHPVEVLSKRFRVIAMDQRNAGHSRAPVSAEDGWQTYAGDHAALLDHLGIERCHLLGGCIGGAYCLGAIEAMPGRIASAVLQQPIGLEDNRQAFFDMFDGFAEGLRDEMPGVEDAAWEAFRQRMYGGDFVFSTSRDFVRGCRTPLLVLMGNDLYHPSSISREIVDLAPDAVLIEHWKEPEHIDATVKRIVDFLEEHTP